MKKLLAILLCMAMLCTASFALAEPLTGEADGYGGPIQAEVTLDGDKIAALKLTGDKETPSLGGVALEKLTEAILASGTLEGVDVVTGATWTSKGAFAAIKKAMGVEEESAQTAAEAVSATGLSHGLGLASTPRLGPGKDDQGMPVYSFNEVVAYVITDAEQRIVDLEVDILEIITPNHDAADDNYIAGWPGSTYNDDHDADGKVDGVIEETTETFVNNLTNWATKRDKGDAYKMNSGTWEQEMDA